MKQESEWHKRDQAILRDVCRYRFTCIASSKTQQFEGKQSGHILKKLSEAGLLEAHSRELPGSISYWTLTVDGARYAKCCEDRSRTLEGQNLDVALAIRWWCVLAGKPGRNRLEPAELKEIFGNAAPPANVPHVVSLFDAICPETRSTYPAVFRAYLPGRYGAAKVVKNIETTITKTLASRLSDWVGACDYGLLCLVESRQVKEALESELERTGLGEQALILVDVAPRTASYKRFLKGRNDVK